MAVRTELITIAVTFDDESDNGPKSWDWATITGDWGNGPSQDVHADVHLMTEVASNRLEETHGTDIWERPGALRVVDGVTVWQAD